VTASSRSTPNEALRVPAGNETVIRSYCCALASPMPGIENYAVTPGVAEVNGKPCW
jgi:hypothetical protein